MKIKRTVTVVQHNHPERYYVIKKLQNTTTPAIGEELSQSQIDALIRKSITVNVVGKDGA